MPALRNAWRGRSRARAFSLAAVLTIAIGTGSSLTVFSVGNALILPDLPYPDPTRLFVLWERSPSGNETRVANPVTFFAMDRSRSIGRLPHFDRSDHVI